MNILSYDNHGSKLRTFYELSGFELAREYAYLISKTLNV